MRFAWKKREFNTQSTKGRRGRKKITQRRKGRRGCAEKRRKKEKRFNTEFTGDKSTEDTEEA
jgi:hypothetical protein